MGAQGEDEDARDPSRFFCPYPGCKRSFAELWRLKVHYRAPPDIRGSGKERGASCGSNPMARRRQASTFDCPIERGVSRGGARERAEPGKAMRRFAAPHSARTHSPSPSPLHAGHGTELAVCPKCNKSLKPGKHHVGCSAGKAAAKANKRARAVRIVCMQECSKTQRPRNGSRCARGCFAGLATRSAARCANRGRPGGALRVDGSGADPISLFAMLLKRPRFNALNTHSSPIRTTTTTQTGAVGRRHGRQRRARRRGAAPQGARGL